MEARVHSYNLKSTSAKERTEFPCRMGNERRPWKTQETLTDSFQYKSPCSELSPHELIELPN